jgi:uncharacterized protein (UPF0335 family)
MKTFPKGLVPLALAVILSTIIVIYSFRESEDPQPIHPHPNDEYLQRIDSLESEKEQLRQQRDSALFRADSIAFSRKADSVRASHLEKEIREIKGRYKNVPQDSLGKIMDERAANAGQTH